MIDESDFRKMLNAAQIYTDALNDENKLWIDYYLRNPRGDERPNESTTVSSDCFDVVESDMPSITRTILGGGDIMEFQPANKKNRAEMAEAEQKTKLINRIILGRDDSFKTLYDWFKGAGIYNFSAVTYYPRETQKREIKVYQNINKIELDSILKSLDESEQVKSAEVIGDIDESGGEFDVTIEIYRTCQDYVIEYISPDKFVISKGGPTLDDCAFVGHYDTYRKGELIEMGLKIDLVESMQGSSHSGYASAAGSYRDTDSVVDAIEAAVGDDGGNEESAPQWYLEEVEVLTACVISADKNGAPDRRRVMWADNQIIRDEPFDHVNYAVLSAYPLPGHVIGLSRVAVTKHSQDQKTFVQRGMFNNMAQVNKPMTAINISDTGTVNREDIAVRRAGGIVRVNGDPSASIMPLVTPSIGAESLQLIQYLDFVRAQSTGALMASQGLNRDDVYSETATRFKGVSNEGAAKLENILRIYAETGIKKLYRGIEWMVKHYQDSMLEETILGEEIAYSPEDWIYESPLYSSIGLAASDTAELIENLGVIYNTQKELKGLGSTLVDDSKLYSTLSRILKTMNVHDTDNFYNDPSQPDQMLKAQNEQLQGLVSQMQMQLEQSSIVNASKEIEQLKAQLEMVKQQSKDSIEAAKLQENARQFDLSLSQKALEAEADLAVEVTKLEQQSNRNYPGGLDAR